MEDTPAETKKQVKDAMCGIMVPSSNLSKVMKEEWMHLLPEFMQVFPCDYRRPRSLSSIGSYNQAIKPQTPRSALQSPTRGSLVLDADEKLSDDSRQHDENPKENPNPLADVMVKLSQLWKMVSQEDEGDQDQNDVGDDQQKKFSCE